MARDLKITVHPPLGGTVRKTAFQDQPPFTAYDSSNMWPVDVLTGRKVYATRPPLQTLTNPGGIVTLLNQVNGVRAAYPFQSFIAAFNGQIYIWDGDSFNIATGAQSAAVDITRPVYACTYLQRVFISESSAKPIVFNYADGTAVTLVETAGTCPSDNRVFATWQGAIWHAGQLATPHVLYGSRVGDPFDYNFAAPATDHGRAFSSTVEGEDGRLNGPITALVAQTSDTLIVSTLTGLVALRGHPHETGIFDRISRDSYILGQGGWCKDPEDNLYFMAPQGLMVLSPSPNATPTLVSKTKVPEELLGLTYTYDNPEFSLAYDTRWNGIIITVRGIQGQSWWYDRELGGFHRMDMSGYPHVLMDFPPLSTDNTSGVLFGGVAYGNLAFFDKFGTAETIRSSAIIGPFPLTQTALEKNKIQALRTILGRDTPGTNTGIFAVAAGTDAQDAVNIMTTGASQFTSDISKLDDNNGVTYPMVSGNAAVIGVVQDSGSLSIEQFAASLSPAGYNRGNRTPQTGISGVPFVPDVPDVFDPTEWVGYSGATPIAPTCVLPDYTHFVDLSRLPASWWAAVAPDGRDIRATDSSNNPLPMDLIEFDSVLDTGFLALKATQTPTSVTSVRLWCGNVGVDLPAANSTYGQYNTYDPNWKAFYASGAENDRTVNLNHLTMTGDHDLTTGYAAGPMGNRGYLYSNVDATNNYGRATASVPTTYPVTLVTAAFLTASDPLPCLGLRDQSAPTAQNLELTANRTAAIHRTDVGSTDSAAVASEDQSATLADAAVWRHCAGVVSGAASRQAYLDGGNTTAADTTSITVTGLDEIILGKGSRSGISSASTPNRLSLSQVHNIVRAECWINYQFQMMNQTTFWGTWSSFTTVNPLPSPTPPDVVACPTGFVSVVETGTWTGYAHATPVAPAEALIDFTHYVNLALMPAAWWTAVSTTGIDIRATNLNNIFIPFDLIEFNKTANTGFLVVKLSQFPTARQQIRLWVGNTTAVSVNACATYGRYAAYDQYYKGFWPAGGGTDRTQNLLHMTAYGGPVVGGVAGPIGNTATDYSGTGQYSAVRKTTGNILTTSPATFMFALNLPAPSNAHEVIFDARHSSTGGAVQFQRRSFSNPTTSLRMFTFPPFGSTSIGVYHDGEPAVADTWHNLTGLLVSGQFNHFIFDDTIRPTKSSSTVLGFGINQIALGAAVTTPGTSFSTPVSGTISLAVARQRVDDDLRETNYATAPWVNYNVDMLTQSTFWGTWTWVASSSTLPQ